MRTDGSTGFASGAGPVTRSAAGFVSNEVCADASMLWKLLTMVESPAVWSTVARLMVAAVFSASVLVPLPPSIEASVP